MSDNSNIEWTDATWNPLAGCSLKSPGCTHCYAMPMAHRIQLMSKANGRNSHYDGTTKLVKGKPVWTGKINLAPNYILNQPLSWRRPRRIFVNSMSDLFHEDVPDEWILDIFTIMAIAGQHTFQVLTKRAERMSEFLNRDDLLDDIYSNWYTFSGGAREVQSWPLHNVWLGVSVEDQKRADERIPHLLRTPSTVRFLSCEPLIGPVNLKPRPKSDMCLHCGGGPADEHYAHQYRTRGLDWVIVGGESGPNARPMHPDWVRSLRDQCQHAGVPFFFKQWGEYLPIGQVLPGCGRVHGGTAVKPGRMKLHYGGTPTEAPKHAFAERGVDFTSTADGRITFRVGKKAAGRLLDGELHDAFPSALPIAA